MLKRGEVVSSIRTVEAHRWEVSKDKKRVASAGLSTGARQIEIDWLPAAAKQYHLSEDINDYVINEVPIVAIDLPNRNLDAFGFQEMTCFNPQQGRLTYKTFIGKPTHQEHDNTDITKAKGLHLDAQLQQGPNGLWHIVVLAAWDRTKDNKLATAILNKEKSGFSMGALVDFTRCSVPGCGETSSTGHIACSHHKNGQNKGGITEDGFLVYEDCMGCNFIEMSEVGDPAQYDAIQTWRNPWTASKTASASMKKSTTHWLPSRRT